MNDNKENNSSPEEEPKKLLGSRRLGRLKSGFSDFKQAYSQEREKLKDFREENPDSNTGTEQLAKAIKDTAGKSVAWIQDRTQKGKEYFSTAKDEIGSWSKEAAEKSTEWIQDNAQKGKEYFDGVKDSVGTWMDENLPEYQQKIDSRVEIEKQRAKVITGKVKRAFGREQKEEIPDKGTFEGVLYWFNRIQGQGSIIKRTKIYSDIDALKPYLQWLILSDYEPNERILSGISTTLEKYDHLLNEELPTKQVLDILSQIEASIPDYIEAIKNMYNIAVSDELQDADVHVKTVKMQLQMNGLLEDELTSTPEEEEEVTQKKTKPFKAPLFTHYSKNKNQQ